MFLQSWGVIRFFLAFLVIASGQVQATAQEVEADSRAARPVPPATLSLTFSKPLLSLIPDMAISIPYLCSSDGTTFFQGLDIASMFAAGATRDPSTVKFSGYGVRAANGASAVSVHFDPLLATGLRNISPAGAMAVSDSKVVLAALAVTADEDDASRAEGKKTQPHPFLLYFDRTGKFLYSASLDLNFTPQALGIFGSGDVLAVGVPTATEGHRHWALLDDHGRLLRNLQPSTEGDESRKVGDWQAHAEEFSTLKGRPSLMPYRGNILILETNTDYPIKELNEGGIVRPLKLKLPPGENLGAFIASDGPTWKIMIGRANAEASREKGYSPGGFITDKIGEFDPETGELLRYIDPGKNHDALSLSCEHDGVFTALREDPQNDFLVVETATIGP